MRSRLCARLLPDADALRVRCPTGYPGDSKNPNGKLRLLYECAPMSFLAEQAGGKGMDGKGRVLDIVPDKVHQRVPLFVGSKNEVDYLMSCLK